MKLSTADLDELSGLIDQMQALPPADRAGWLARLDAARAHLRPHLQPLLDPAADMVDTAAAPGALIDALSGLLPMPAGGDDDLQPGRLIGPYRLLRAIGEGGMGSAWLAERADGAMQRQVALKLPHTFAAPGRDLARRWVRERDILASLEHPHIARLYDAGASAAGRPYLALEYVEGLPITRHCDEHRLSVRERVALFRQVLAAVQFAHAHLVVHRDLKPSNIYVTADGQARLLDFGIAKLLQRDAASAAEGAELTELGIAPLTPDYASPEQITGQAIGTSSDVYSLGVVFYELLCGRRPYRLARSGRAALEQAISESDPQRPSRTAEAAKQEELAALRSVRPAGLRRQLQGDLDNVALKALEKLPSRRYPSAEAFSLDLQRWLEGLPVQAHPAGAAYRAAKFVRRHRVAVGAAALATLSLAAGLGGALYQAGLAEREALRAQAVQRFVTGLFKEAAPAKAQGRDVLVRDLMARGERELREAAADDPVLRADLAGVLAGLYGDLGDAVSALPLAEARRDAAHSAFGDDSLPYAQALAALAKLQGQLSRFEPALQTLKQAQRLLEGHGSAGHGDFVDSLTEEAFFLQQTNRSEEASALLEQAVPLLEARHGADSWVVVRAQVDRATSAASHGDLAQAQAIVDALLPRVERPRPELGLQWPNTLGDIGYVLWQARRWAEAEQVLERAIAEFDRLAGPRNSPAIEAGRTLGMVQLDAGHYALAAASLGRNTERAVAFYGANDGEAALNRSFEVMALMRIDQPARAQASAAESVRVSEAVGSSLSAFDRRGLRRRLAATMALNGNAAGALALADEVAAEEVAAAAIDTRHAGTQLTRFGALRALGRSQEALQAVRRAAEICGALNNVPGRLCAARARLNEALAAIDARELDRVPALVDDAEQRMSQVHGERPHPDQQYAAVVRAAWHAARGEREQAERVLAQARERFEQLSGARMAQKIDFFF